VKLFRAVVGIDPSGGRLAVVALQGGLGGFTVVRVPLCHEYRGDKAATRLEEAETVLGEFVARNGLLGAEAFLVLPADQVYMARAGFPSLRERDLREAVGLELERLFPVPPATLRYGYRRLQDPLSAGRTLLTVAAVPAEYLDRWEEILSRAGLSLAAAVPAGWAGLAAISRRASGSPEPVSTSVLLRWLGDSVECTVASRGEPLFCVSRPCAPEAAPEEGISLALSGLTDLPGATGETPVDLFAPPGWFPEGEFRREGGFRFQTARGIPDLPGGIPAKEGGDPFALLSACGAVPASKRMDLLAPQRAGASSMAARVALAVAAAAALSLGAAWPVTVAWKAKTELRHLDARVSALRPFAEQYQECLSDLDDIQARSTALREAASSSRETLEILKELTDRVPNGTWALSLRIDDRKVDMEGLSPSASEIFPALTREGRFRSVEFGAPITRQADNMERFKIRGEYVPGSTPPAAATRAVQAPAAAPPAAAKAPAAGPTAASTAAKTPAASPPPEEEDQTMSPWRRR
jgi:Tfp pilus assembly protein PilN